MLDSWRLTETEIQAVFDRPGRDTDDDWGFHQAVADAATAKSLRWALTWLRKEAAPSFREVDSQVVEDVANMLEKMLTNVEGQS